MWFLTNNIDWHFVETRKHWGAETAQYRLKIIFKYHPVHPKTSFLSGPKKAGISYLEAS